MTFGCFRSVSHTCDVQQPGACQSDDHIASRDAHEHHPDQVYMSGGVLEVYDNVVFETNVALAGLGGAVRPDVDISSVLV